VDKRGIKRGIAFILIALLIVVLTIFIPKIFAMSSSQYFIGTRTCENFQDSILWSAVGTSKLGTAIAYYNWTVGNSCPGNSSRDCDIIAMGTYARYVNTGAAIAAHYAWVSIANITESKIQASSATYTRNASLQDSAITGGD